MTSNDPAVMRGVLDLLGTLKEDWEYGGEIGPETKFIGELGLESLEIVVLATQIQERYGRLPFPEFFDEIGQRPVEDRDVSVGELVNFICTHRRATQEV